MRTEVSPERNARVEKPRAGGIVGGTTNQIRLSEAHDLGFPRGNRSFYSNVINLSAIDVQLPYHKYGHMDCIDCNLIRYITF